MSHMDLYYGRNSDFSGCFCAINAKTIVVKFNKAVQKGIAIGGAELLTNYTLGTANPTRVTLSDDLKQATITFGTAGFVSDLNKYVQFQVENIKDVNGKTLTSYKAPLLLEDNSIPQATASFVAPNTVVGFNEPVAISGTPSALTNATVAVDGVAIPAAASLTNNSYTVTTDSSVDTLQGATKITIPGLSVGTHTVTIIGAKDLAGNILPEYNTTVTVGSDSVAPTVTSLTATGNKVRVEFSEPIADSTLNLQASTRVWVTLDGVNVYLTSANQVDTAGKVYEVDATSAILSGNFKNVATVVKGAKDASGNNISADVTQTLLVTKDTTAPKVVSTTVKDDKIIVKFDESIQATGTPVASLTGTYTTADGVRNDVTAATIGTPVYVYDANNDGDTTDAGENQYLVIPVTQASLLTSGKLSAGSYSFNLGSAFLQDNALVPNTVATTTISFAVASDSATSAVVTATPSQVSAGVLQFAFNKELTDSQLNVNNFTINGVSLPVGTKLYFYGTKQVVRAELPAGTIGVTGNRTLAVKGIVDKDGNTLTQAAKDGLIVPLTETVKPVAQSLTLVDAKTLNVELSEAIVNPSAATGVELWVNGTKVVSTDVALAKATGVKGTDTRLVLTTTAFNLDPSQTIVVKFVEGTTVQDAAGNTVTVGQVQK